MLLSEKRRKQLEQEFKFSASRSSGPGGQNVNKVSTKIELRFPLLSSQIFTDEEKQRIQAKLKNRINTEGEIILISGTERTQWQNRKKVTDKFFILIEKAVTPVKKRIKTSPTALSRLKRLESKKQQSQRKQMRRPPEA
ncbi:MAG: alternative ribosome rescue aminoacyl-tRNA hydrolase ArfB [Bacteroidota bacterium]